jgi:ubiquinone/menaquinone biosynthesis C-methylase UbiE
MTTHTPMTTHTHHPHGMHHTHTSPSDANTEANRIHFDAEAHKYDDQPFAVEIAQRQAKVIIGAHTFDENSTVVMDYACGTGDMPFSLSTSD